MTAIREIVQQALNTGCLTLESEKHLGQLLLSASYTLEDWNAYMSLQLAAMAGSVKRESLEWTELSYGAF